MKTFRAALLVASLTLSAHAFAGDDVVTAEAKQRMAEGKKLFGDGQYDAAWIKYMQACVVLKSDNCTRGLAFTEYRAGKFVEAYGHLKELLEPVPKPSITPQMAEEMRRAMGDAYSKIGHVAITAPSATVVSLDGKELGHAPFPEPIAVSAGMHEFSAGVGASMGTRRVAAAAGELVELRFEETAPIIGPVQSSATSTTTPTTERRERASDERTSHIPAGSIVLGAGAIAAAGLGTLFLVLANAKQSEADSISTSPTNGSHDCARGASAACAQLADIRSSYSSRRGLEATFFIGAGALAAGAVTWWLVSDHHGREAGTEQSQARIVPLVGPSGAGAMLDCRF